MMNELKGRGRLLCAGLAMAAVVMTAPAAFAQNLPNLTKQLMRPVELPIIQFNHHSQVHYENGVLWIDNGEATDTVFGTAPAGTDGFQAVNAADIVLRVLGETDKVGGLCPALNGVPTYELRGNGRCQQVNTSTGGVSWGTLNLRLNVSTAAFPEGGYSMPGVPLDANGQDACGVVGGSDNLCVRGEVFHCANAIYPSSCTSTYSSPYGAGPDGIALRGRVKTAQELGVQTSAAFMNNVFVADHGNVDFFEYVFEVSGGTLPANFTYHSAGAADPRRLFALEFIGLRDQNPATALVNWTTPFAEGIDGYAAVTGYGSMLLGCTAQIKGFVTDYFNPAATVAGAEVQIASQPNAVPAADGSYATAASMCAGTYNVTVLPPSGYSVYGADTQSVTLLANGSVVSGVNFRIYASPLNTTAYTTFVQAGWGTKPKGQNAGMLLKTYFNFLYPTGELVIGDPLKFTITETGAEAVQDFLPQEGRPAPLGISYVDPPSRLLLKHKGKASHHRRIGSLAGETLALELNVRFSAFSLTRAGIGQMHIASGKFMGKTVNELLALANSVLGGNPLPIGIKYDDVEDAVERVNKNFQAGTTDNHFLVP